MYNQANGVISMTDSKARRVASLEALILHPSTGEHERNASIGRWEAITGQKWTGKQWSKSNPSGGQQRQQGQRTAQGNYGRGTSYKDYDFSRNTCTQKQYDYVKSISDFFRWKCPRHEDMEFEEAQDFLNRYSELFKMFSPYGRNFSNLKKLFEAFGIDWNQTKRTFKWKAFHEC